MRINLLLGYLFCPFIVFAQLNCKETSNEKGSYLYCYHKNGKISTERFKTTSQTYMAQGYSKAFDTEGNEIYNEKTSQSGLISSVNFTYYENGAVKSANYSAHPDAGIQWFEKTVYFDKNGNITSQTELETDNQGNLQSFSNK